MTFRVAAELATHVIERRTLSNAQDDDRRMPCEGRRSTRAKSEAQMLVKRALPSALRSRTTVLLLCAAAVLFSSESVGADPLRDCEQLQEPARAIRACSLLISAVPGNAMLHNKRGIAYFKNGETDLAIADYAEAIRLDPRAAHPYYNRGRALLSKNDFVNAIPDFTEAISRKPRDALARNGRAWALFKLGNIPAALEDADHAIAADAKYAPAYDTRAHIYEALSRRDQGHRRLSQSARARSA